MKEAILYSSNTKNIHILHIYIWKHAFFAFNLERMRKV